MKTSNPAIKHVILKLADGRSYMFEEANIIGVQMTSDSHSGMITIDLSLVAESVIVSYDFGEEETNEFPKMPKRLKK